MLFGEVGLGTLPDEDGDSLIQHKHVSGVESVSVQSDLLHLDVLALPGEVQQAWLVFLWLDVPESGVCSALQQPVGRWKMEIFTPRNRIQQNSHLRACVSFLVGQRAVGFILHPWCYLAPLSMFGRKGND